MTKQTKQMTGKYTKEGIAIDKTAILESICKYQEALNLFYKELGSLKVPDVPVEVKVKEVGLRGSFCKGKGRIGTYRDISFEAVNEMQTWGKIQTRDMDWTYCGIYWSGHGSQNYNYPSDLDIFLTHTQTTLGESFKVDDKIKDITRKIFDKTGVYIQFSNVMKPNDTFYIPLELIKGNGFIKRVYSNLEPKSQQVA